MERLSNTLIRFAYNSRSASGLADDALLGIVQKSWQNNIGKRIFGLLEFRNGRFSQVIEGPLHHMNLLIPAILSDDRHTTIELTAMEAIVDRTFTGWTVTGFEGVEYDREIRERNSDPAGNVIYTDRFGKRQVALGSRSGSPTHHKGARPDNEPGSS